MSSLRRLRASRQQRAGRAVEPVGRAPGRQCDRREARAGQARAVSPVRGPRDGVTGREWVVLIGMAAFFAAAGLVLVGRWPGEYGPFVVGLLFGAGVFALLVEGVINGWRG